jgi:hypothetical protein
MPTHNDGERPVEPEFISSAAAARYLPTTIGWAVRRSWHWGEHEFVCWRATLAKARRAVSADVAHWSSRPIRPRHHLVQISWAEYRILAAGPSLLRRVYQEMVNQGWGQPVPPYPLWPKASCKRLPERPRARVTTARSE